MKAEEIVVHFLILVLILFIAILSYQVWRYLNNKSLGQETILDKMVKDFIIFLMCIMIFNWITWIKVVPKYNYHIAMTLMKIGLTFRVCLVAQTLVYWIARYLLVFHFAIINNFDEITIKLASRTFIAILVLFCVIFEDLTKDVKLKYLTESHIDEKFDPQRLQILPIIGYLTTIIIVFVQGRIIYLRWKHPLPQQPVQDENNDTYDWKIVCAVCTFTLIVLHIVRRLGYFIQIVVLSQLILFLSFTSYVFIAIIALIYSNHRMFIYVKKNIFPQNLQIAPQPVIPQHDNIPPDTNEEPIHLEDQPAQEMNRNPAIPHSHSPIESSNTNSFTSFPLPQPINALPDVSV